MDLYRVLRQTLSAGGVFKRHNHGHGQFYFRGLVICISYKKKTLFYTASAALSLSPFLKLISIHGPILMPKPTCDKRRRRAAPKALRASARDAEGVKRRRRFVPKALKVRSTEALFSEGSRGV